MASHPVHTGAACHGHSECYHCLTMNTVTCAACGTVNPAGQKFCGECAAALPRVCPNCGASVAPEQKFCGECAASLQQATISPDLARLAPSVSSDARPTSGLSAAPSAAGMPASPPPTPAPSEERRLVTALFCDLVGFTPLSESLDPEDIRDIQAEYFEAMRGQIERYGGTVEKYAGDAVLALFGAPAVHEDDAERAVLCALGMQAAIEPVAERARQRWNVEPAIRVGVNTGDVVSGVWDTGTRQDVAVTGDAVNAAARIQAAAEPGEVLAAAETMRLTRRRIKYGERRDLVLKGKSGMVPGYPAVGIREQLGERWEEGERATPLVGRDREMLELLDAWMRAQGGEGQLVTLTGEPGVGKSRLVAELVDRASSTSAIRVLRGRCLSYGQEISLWLLADLLRSLFGIREQDSLDEIGPKLEVALQGLLAGSDPESRREAVDVAGEVLGLAPGNSVVGSAEAPIRRQALIRSLRLVLGALSQRVATMVVLEDLHWIDQASQDVLREIVPDVPGLRMLVLVTHRSGWAEPWTEWSWPERISLRPLREHDAAVLAGAVLGGVNLSPGLERYVGERAGGNPFFVEELLRTLEETGGVEQRNGQMHLVPGIAQRLPSTLTEILLARLDRLEAQVRTVAQVGSVIGTSFAVRLLAQVVGREQVTLEMPLSALQESEIAFPRRSPDLEYVFKHVTMQEVAYNTLVQKRRKDLHLQTARAIAHLYPSDEYAEMIAYHYAKTDEHEEAIPWLEKAGDRAAAIYASDPALAAYEEARRRLNHVGGREQDLARLDEKLGGVLQTAGRYEEAIPVLEGTTDAYRNARDLEAAGRTTTILGWVHRRRGTPAEGIGRVQSMIDLMAWSGPSPALASLHVALAHLLFLIGKYREQMAAAEQGAAIARALGDDRLLGEAEMRRGTALDTLGDPEQGRKVLEGALPLVEAGGDLITLFTTLNNLGAVMERLGRMDQAMVYAERGLVVTERIGNPGIICFALGNLGDQLTVSGDWRSAREALERGVALARTIDRSSDIVNTLLELGKLSLREGDWDAASRYLTEALALTDETGDRESREDLQVFLADLDVQEGRHHDAVARLEPLIVQEDADFGMLLPATARALVAIGDEEHMCRAGEIAERAVTLTRTQPGRLPDALYAQGMVFAAQGRLDEANRVLTEGLERARSLPYPYVEGRILVELASAHGQRGESEGERERLQEALAIFWRLGARKDVERVEEALSAISDVKRS